MPEKIESALTLHLSDEDLKGALSEVFGENQAKFAYMMLTSLYRRLAAGTEGIGIADVLYIAILAKKNGLDPWAGEWYSPIPRPNGRGFSICFRLDAAFHILANHPKMEWWDWFYINGAGDILKKTQAPRWRKAADIDWGLQAIVQGKFKDVEKIMEYPAAYQEWYALDKEGNPKPLWVKMGPYMTLKSGAKQFVRAYLGANLPFEDQVDSGLLLPSGGENGFVVQASPAAPAGGEGGAEQRGASPAPNFPVAEAPATPAVVVPNGSEAAALEEAKRLGVTDQAKAELEGKKRRGRKPKGEMVVHSEKLGPEKVENFLPEEKAGALAYNELTPDSQDETKPAAKADDQPKATDAKGQDGFPADFGFV